MFHRLAPWFTHRVDERIERILRAALETADQRGVSRPHLTDLSAEDRNHLALSTLAYLRTRPHTPSPHPKWRQVRGFDAGVLRWWNDHLGGPYPSPATRRLQTLRSDIYDFLDDELHLVVKEPGQSSPVHLAPADDLHDSPSIKVTDRTIHVSDHGAGFGDAETNRLVEAAAMRVAIETYAGWDFDDVSKDKCGWDITFRRNDREEHVEVKGVKGQKPRVLLTRGEVAVAQRDPLWKLLVVTRALVAPQPHPFERERVLEVIDPYVYVADLTY